MSSPLDTSLIEQRIRDQVNELAAGVAGVAEYAAVMDLRSFRTPSAYVVLAQEKGVEEPMRPQRRPSGRQQAQATFGVVIAVRNYRDSTGKQAQLDASPLIGSVRRALMGWTPGVEIMRSIEWLQGDVLDYDANTLLWIDVFTTTHFI